MVLTASIGKLAAPRSTWRLKDGGRLYLNPVWTGCAIPPAALREEDLPRLQELPSVESTLPVLMKYTDVYMHGGPGLQMCGPGRRGWSRGNRLHGAHLR